MKKTPAISYQDAKLYGCPYCGLSIFPGSDRDIEKDGYFSQSCYDDDQTNMDASGGCGQSYYVYLDASSLPGDATIIAHPRQGHRVHDDGQHYKYDSLYDEIVRKLGAD